MNTSETPALTDAELKLLQTLVYQECGMHFDDRRTSFLQDRLQRRLKECQLDSFYSYYRLLISQQGKQELSCLLENLTVNETSFFRNKAQLDLFQRDAIDEILRRKQERRLGRSFSRVSCALRASRLSSTHKPPTDWPPRSPPGSWMPWPTN